MEKPEYTAAWQGEFELFWNAVVSADLATPVPTCPDWTIRDLVAHLDMCARRYAQRMNSATPPESQTPPSDAADPRAALAESAAALTTALTALEVTDPAWNWAPISDTAWFWFRRAACEAAIHRWDAQSAVRATQPIPAELSVEGIAEVLDSFIPAGRRRTETGAVGLVHVLAADAGAEWYVRWRKDRYTLVSTDDSDLPGKPVVARAVGSASDLFLALWGRVPLGTLECEGDLEPLEALRAK